jgi:hypothetical protein
VKKVAQMYASSVILKKLPKENNSPIVENSPNLATLPHIAFRLIIRQVGIEMLSNSTDQISIFAPFE